MIDLAERRVQKLTDSAIEHLQAGRYQEALEVSAELEYAKGPLAFYLAGEAYAALDDLKTAVATMRRGVLKKPTFWCNWFYLGIYLCRLKKYKEALAAYDQALLCPVVNVDMVRLNMGIAAIDAGDHAAALRHLDGLDDPGMRWSVQGSRILALEGVGRNAEAAELADHYLKDRPEGNDEYNIRVGFVAAALARVRLRQGESKEEVRGFLLDCLGQYGCSTAVLRELADLDGLRYSKESKYFRFVIHANLPSSHPSYRQAPGYYVMYDVISDTESGALDMINRFESAAGIESLDVIDCKIREESPEHPIGVCWVERFFY